jgi:hypothetical protein
MFSHNKILLGYGGAVNLRPPESALAWLAYTAFGALFLYVLAAMIAAHLNYAQITLIAALLSLGFVAWKYCRQTIGAALNRIELSHIMLAAAALRLAWVLLSGIEQTSDFAGYDAYAMQIVKRGVFLSVIWAPGASIFFALQYWLFGHIPLIAQSSLALLSTSQIYLVYGITRRTLDDKNAGKLAAIVLALWPEHIIYNNVLCTEVPFTTLVLLSIWLLWPEGRRFTWRALLSGACLGAAHWVRPTAPLFLVPVLLLLLLGKQRPASIWDRGRMVVAVVAGFAVLLGLLIYYNYRDLGIMSVTSNKRSGYNLLFGTNFISHGFYNEADIKLVGQEGLRRGIPPGKNSYYARDRAAYLAYDRIARELAIARIKEHPLRVLHMAIVYKIPEMWGYPAGLIWSFEKSRFSEYYYIFAHTALIYNIMALGLCAWAVLRHRKYFATMDERWACAAALLIAVLSHVVLEVQPRYHHPFLPILAICIGAYALQLRKPCTAETEISGSAGLSERTPQIQRRAHRTRYKKSRKR